MRIWDVFNMSDLNPAFYEKVEDYGVNLLFKIWTLEVGIVIAILVKWQPANKTLLANRIIELNRHDIVHLYMWIDWMFVACDKNYHTK